MDLLRLSAGGAAGDVVRYAHSYIGLGLTPVVAVDLDKGEQGVGTGNVHAWCARSPGSARSRSSWRTARVQRFDSLVFANIAQMAKVATTGGGDRYAR